MKSVFSFCVIAIVFVFSACKKSGSDGNDPSPLEVSLVPAAPKAGLVQLSAQKLILHPGNQAIVTAKWYDGSGNGVVSPAVSWSSNSPNVTVTSGVINAISVGEALVTVSNASLGQASVTVSVVPPSTAIPSGPANILFGAPVKAIESNTSASLPNYTLTDWKGNTVTGAVTFEIRDMNGSAISNNTITAGNSTGLGQVVARYNGQYLNGSLLLNVYNPGASDTTVSFTVSQFPSVFSFYEETAPAIKLRVTETWGPGVNIKWYETTPDKIGVQFPNVIALNSTGQLISKFPGITPVTIGYKKAKVTLFSAVNVDLTGSWSGSQGGVTYNFCIQRRQDPIIFDLNVIDNTIDTWLQKASQFMHYNLNWPYVNGSATVSNNPAINASAVTSETPIPTTPGKVGPIDASETRVGQVLLLPNTTPMQFNWLWQNDLDKIKMSNGVMLTKGGNCSATGGQSLARTLCNGSSKTWRSNSCYFLDFDVSSIRFMSDSSAVMTTDGGNAFTLRWGVSGNSSFKIADNGGSFYIFYVSSYNDDAISFSQIYERDASTNPPDDENYFTGSGGCTYGLIKQ